MKLVNYGNLLNNNEFNDLFIQELNNCITNYSQDDKYKQKVFALSKLLFNEIYPKIYKEKLKKYKNYTWIIVTIKDNTIGCTDLPSLDFSEPWHQYHDNDIFRKLNENDKKIIQSSVMMTLSKNKLFFGFNSLSPNNHLFEEIISHNDNITKLFGRIYSFLNIYLLLCSFDYFTITSKEQKNDVFNYIIDNFEVMKKIYDINNPNRKKFIE